MIDLRRLCTQPEDLLRQDVAKNNLICAADLPGEPTVEQCVECIDRLDHYGKGVAHYTEQRMQEFRRDPGLYDGHEGIFRVRCMVTLLQKMYGVRYHPDKRADQAKFETADCFIYGALLGQGGTCASLPVIYVAVGRRLSYPLKLVQAPCHLLCRWEEPGKRFNIEVNDSGLSCPLDDHYLSGKYKLEPWLLKQTRFLQSQTPREELAGFLSQRGHCWRELGKYKDAAEAFIWAQELAPEHKLHGAGVISTLLKWKEGLDGRVPPNCPHVQMRLPPRRRYPASLPASIEENVIRLEVLENLLNDTGFEINVAQPLRANPRSRPSHVPQKYFINVAR
jgi:hypothetical protein